MNTIGTIYCIFILAIQINQVSIGYDKTHIDIWTNTERAFIFTQIQESEPLLRITNYGFCLGAYESYLEVEYTYSNYSGAIPLMVGGYNRMYIKLLLSLDNMSFIEVQRNDIDEKQGRKNGSGVFRVSHSFFSPFPFNIEKNSTLFIKLNRVVYRWSICRTPSVAVQVPIDIERPWIYSVNLILLFPPLIVFSALGSIFLVSRRKRPQKVKIPT